MEGYCLVTMFMTITLICKIFDVVEGKGRAGLRLDDNRVKARVYPSEVRRKYYTYYINYFTPSGFIYAETQHGNARTVTLCENYEPYYDNATYLGVFPCPMENDPDDFTCCCGESKYQYCCKRVDTPSFRLMLGLSITACLGFLIGILICICVAIKSKKKARERKRQHAQNMVQLGIPKYEETVNSLYEARQSEDGYQILVKFKSKKFYEYFKTQLLQKYPNVLWKHNSEHGAQEGKISYPDGTWVTLLISPSFSAGPNMLVLREKSAVKWMHTDFEQICSSLPDEMTLCGCCRRPKRTHPAVEPTNSDNSRKYEKSRAGESTSQKAQQSSSPDY